MSNNLEIRSMAGLFAAACDATGIDGGSFGEPTEYLDERWRITVATTLRNCRVKDGTEQDPVQAMKDDLAAVVARSATLLDDEMPGWFERIDTTELDMNSSLDCIVGQLRRSGAAPMLSDMDAARGLFVDEYAYPEIRHSSGDDDAPLVALGAAWIEQIKLRGRADYQLIGGGEPVAGVDYEAAQPTWCDWCEDRHAQTVVAGAVLCRQCARAYDFGVSDGANKEEEA